MTSTSYPKHIPLLPYSDPPGRLRTLDIWLPRPLEEKPLQTSNSLWVVYLHGGAWRDATKDATNIEPTLKHLFSNPSSLENVAGIASLNYRLSPYPSHPSDPSSPSDEERNAQHPQHIRDVCDGIKYLQQEYGMKRWIGVGQSCGATLLLQLVAGIGTKDLPTESSKQPDPQAYNTSPGPEALILLAGIYNLPLLLRNHSPPTCSEQIAQIYRDIATGAFGADPSVYTPVSPVSGSYTPSQWPEGRLLLLCHSYEDELVERAQRDVMCVALDRSGWSLVMEVGDEEDEVRAEGRRVLNVRDLKGKHDWVWKDGDQIAKLIAEVAGRLG
ncbi:alpha/beta-hydrolase [Clathrospora elynae]|uniref:Kynurenine formamidase n=1 Tax=Clathrospora elynae TaxID=706981 RepID=A0A6A5SQ97_9PLEO|nr:alpha/beta-hydrolase [Clathrospora elynae]